MAVASTFMLPPLPLHDSKCINLCSGEKNKRDANLTSKKRSYLRSFDEIGAFLI